jgi:hypothetical protein
MGPFSLYEYLSYILPGSTVLFVAAYGWYGWPYKEPGATALLGLIAASFIIGTAVHTVGTYLVEPVILGSRPGARPDSLWGQFGQDDRHYGEQEAFEALFRDRYGADTSLAAGFALARTEVQKSPGSGDGLDTLNQQIGFSRGMATGCLTGLAIECVLAGFGRTHLLPGLWIPTLAVTTWLFAYRLRRFWRWYGDYVLRSIKVIASGK